MKLTKLKLHNYKQHADKELTFTGNVIGIIGHNGVGKSNLLGAIHFALGGEQPGFTKTDLLKWGESEGSIELHFIHNGIAGSITRSIHSNSAQLKYGDDTPITGSKKVEERITALTGLDKDLLKQAIFVRQAEIDSILFTDPRVREMSFQKLCGIGDSAKIHKKMGDILAEMAVPPNYDVQIAEARLRHTDATLRCTKLKEQAAVMQQTRNQCPDFTQLQADLAKHEQLSFHIDRMQKMSTDMDNTVKRINQEEASLASITIPDGDIGVLDTQITDLQTVIQQANLYHRALADFEAKGKAILALGSEPVIPPPPFTEQQLQDLESAATSLRQAYDKISNDVQLYDGLKKAITGKTLSAGVECPVCGNTITDTERLSRKLAECKHAFSEAQNKATAAAVQLQTARNQNQETITNASRQLTIYKTQYASLVEQYQRAEAILDSTKKIDEDLGQLQQRLSSLVELRKQVLTTSTSQAQLTATIKSHKDYLVKLTEEYVEVRNNLLQNKDIAGYIEGNKPLNLAKEAILNGCNSLRAAITTAQQLDRDLAQLNGMIKELETTISDVTTSIAKMELKRSQQGGYKEVLQTLTEVRDWFHYMNGPHTLASGVLAEMTQDVNMFLEEFAAPFTVVAADDAMGFRYQMHDGSAMPATPPDAMHLSGGQRIQLAISFRFAAYCMFANKLGLLSLDEPSVYLDNANVARLCTVLKKVKYVAQRMDLQIFIATHERSILPFVDTIIDLSETATEDQHEQISN